MNDKFDIEITSPTTKILASIDWVEVYGISGSFLVGPDHSPLVSILGKGGKIIYKKHETQDLKEISVTSGGIFKVGNNKASLLLDC